MSVNGGTRSTSYTNNSVVMETYLENTTGIKGGYDRYGI